MSLRAALLLPLCQAIVLLRQRRAATGDDKNTPGYEEIAFAREARAYLLNLTAQEAAHG